VLQLDHKASSVGRTVQVPAGLLHGQFEMLADKSGRKYFIAGHGLDNRAVRREDKEMPIGL